MRSYQGASKLFQRCMKLLYLIESIVIRSQSTLLIWYPLLFRTYLYKEYISKQERGTGSSGPLGAVTFRPKEICYCPSHGDRCK